MKPLALLLFAVIPVTAAAAESSVDWTRDPLAQVRSVVPATAPPAEKLECRPDVIAAFQEAWSLAGKGSAEYEAVFRIDRRDDGGLDIVFAPLRKDLILTTSITIVPARTIAIAHTHPDDAEPEPGPNDHTSPVPNFVISHDSLYVTVPGTRLYRRARRDWRFPCAAS